MRKNGKNYYFKEINNNKIKFNSEEMISARHTSENSLILLQIMKTNFFHLRNGMKIYTYKHFSAYFSFIILTFSCLHFLIFPILTLSLQRHHIYIIQPPPNTPYSIHIYMYIYISHLLFCDTFNNKRYWLFDWRAF